MTVNLNRPAIDPGPLTGADLEEARRHNPGSIWHPHRHLMPHGLDQQGRYETRTWGDSCAPEGGEWREPSAAPSYSKSAPYINAAWIMAAWLWDQRRPWLVAGVSAASALVLILV